MCVEFLFSLLWVLCGFINCFVGTGMHDGLGRCLLWSWNGEKFVTSGDNLQLVLASASDNVSDNSSSSYVVSGSSELLNVGNVKSFPGRGIGILFLHLLSCTGISLV